MIFLVEKYLYESIEGVKKQYKNIPDEDFYTLIQCDPKYNPKRDSVGKAGKWLLSLYKKRNPLSLLYPDDIKNLLTQFYTYVEDRNYTLKESALSDLKRLEDLVELIDAVKDGDYDAELSERQKLRGRRKSKDYEMLAATEDDTAAAFKVLSWEGDVALGAGTEWCTADSRPSVGKEYYDEYLEFGGHYYIIIDKEMDEKYQIQLESQQFMDSKDEQVELEYLHDMYPDLMDAIETDSGFRELLTAENTIRSTEPDWGAADAEILGDSDTPSIIAESDTAWGFIKTLIETLPSALHQRLEEQLYVAGLYDLDKAYRQNDPGKFADWLPDWAIEDLTKALLKYEAVEGTTALAEHVAKQWLWEATPEIIEWCAKYWLSTIFDRLPQGSITKSDGRFVLNISTRIYAAARDVALETYEFDFGTYSKWCKSGELSENAYNAVYGLGFFLDLEDDIKKIVKTCVAYGLGRAWVSSTIDSLADAHMFDGTVKAINTFNARNGLVGYILMKHGVI